MDHILQTHDLTKKFGRKTALDRVNMTVQRGDIYGFIGGNGAGKTTLMRVALRLAFPTSGSVSLFGGESFATAGRRIGALIESPAFYRSLSARENLKAFGSLVGASPSQADELLERVGLADAGKKKAGAFSLGMKQRLGLAVALLGNPELVILDEPVNGLDPSGMRDVRDLILQYNREKGVTFLISSHLLDELSKVATRYGILKEGRLIDEVTAEDLFERTRHRLSITVDDPHKAVAALWRSDIRVEGRQLTIFSGYEDPAAVNRTLVQAGVAVSRLVVQSDGLEQYFMERIGDSHA